MTSKTTLGSTYAREIDRLDTDRDVLLKALHRIEKMHREYSADSVRGITAEIAREALVQVHPKVPHGQCRVCFHYGDDCTGIRKEG